MDIERAWPGSPGKIARGAGNRPLPPPCRADHERAPLPVAVAGHERVVEIKQARFMSAFLQERITALTFP